MKFALTLLAAVAAPAFANGEFFDDFSQADVAALRASGWVLRDGTGHPGLPGTRFAVEAYVHFVAERSLLEAVASSLTELFSPAIIQERVSGMLAGYPFVTRQTLAYFDKRLTQAPRDSNFALAYVIEHARNRDEQELVLEALRFKCGAFGTIEGSTVTWPENLEGSVALFGERGSVKVGGTALNRKILWKVEGQLEHEREMLIRDTVDPPTVYGYSHREQIAEMAAAIREGRQPSTNGREARRSLALVCAIYESVRTRREVAL